MKRFFVAPDAVGPDTVTVTGSDVNHIKNVLRMRAGSEAEIVSGDNRLFRCAVREIAPDAVTFSIVSEVRESRELPVEITLFQGLPKGDKMEFIVQKAVELGAKRIVPVEMKRSVVKLDNAKETKKNARYQAVAESAAKQAGRSIIPEVAHAMSFDDAVTFAHDRCGLVIVPYECETDGQTSAETFLAAQKASSVAVFIGPEGGFEREEIEKLEEAGAKTVTLGKRILRTETAGLTALSILMYLTEIG